MPFVPGIVLSISGRWNTPKSLSQYIALGVGALVLIAGISFVNWREGRKLQAELDALDAAHQRDV